MSEKPEESNLHVLGTSVIIKSETENAHINGNSTVGSAFSEDPIWEEPSITLSTNVSNFNENHATLIPPPPPPLKKPRKVKPAICTLCGTSFPTRDLYDRHFTTDHKDELPYSCSYCSKRFALPLHVKTHETIHNPNRFTGPPKFQCHLCDKRYHLKVSLKSHIKKSHLGYKPRNKTVKEPVIQHHSTKGTKNPNPYRKPLGTHQCPFCERFFNWRIKLFDHITLHIKEKPYTCSICQQPFPFRRILLGHIRNIHDARTSTEAPSYRPKWQARQPCPCSVCGLILKIPSQLKRHMRVHTGEKPYKCDHCGMHFRLKCGLRKHTLIHKPPDADGLHTFKCQVCGKEGYKRFPEMRNHRTKGHKHIPVMGDLEKSFGCGVCGKPFYLRIQAVICALLGHDPSYLQKHMFKTKCPECPPERFGYPNLEYLRRHWSAEHEGKVLPAELRRGMNFDDPSRVDAFQRVSIDKVKAQEIRMNGPPNVKTDFPLFVELPLLPVSEEERMRNWKGQRRDYKKKLVNKPEIVKCPICDVNFARQSNMKRHLAVVHDPNKVPKKLTIFKSAQGENKYDQMEIVRKHERKEHRIGGNEHSTQSRTRPSTELEVKAGGAPSSRVIPEKRKPESRRECVPVSASVLEIGDLVIKQEPLELICDEDEDLEDIRVPSNHKCKFCSRNFNTFRALGTHEGKAHLKSDCGVDKLKKVNSIKPSLESHPCNHQSVNVKDTAAVSSLLGNRVLEVKLTRLVA